MKYDKVAKRLREAMNESHMTAQELSERSVVNKSSISQYVNGKNCPSNKNAGMIARVLGVSPVWLMDLSQDKYGRIANAKSVKVPVFGSVAAGIPIEAIEDIIDYEEISADMAQRGEFFGLRIKGDSMSPRIMDGDTVIVRSQPDVESGDVAIVMVNGHDATCKRVIKSDGGLTLIPFNPAYQTKQFSKKDLASVPVTIIGKVVELRGKF